MSSTSETFAELMPEPVEERTFDRVMLSIMKGFPLEVSYQIESGFHSPWHEAFFCSHCGEVWARVYYPGTAESWILRDNCCFDCREQSLHSKPNQQGFLPGGIVSWLDDSMWKDFPLTVLKRELLIWTPAMGSVEWATFLHKADAMDPPQDVTKLIMEIHNQ